MHKHLILGLLLAVATLSAASGSNLVEREAIFSEARANPYWCALNQCPRDFDVDIRTKDSGVTVSLLKNGKTIYSFDDCIKGVFGVLDNTLWYATYSVINQGGTVYAVNLSTGKQLWKHVLEGVADDRSYARYSNALNLTADGQQVTILGKESFGWYIEVIDAKTGKTISHKITGSLEKYPAPEDEP
ncbi:MAG TPA: hypothetical protein VHI52_08260 [Verrucomicrobiae bacterium]|nr:hypothetical protein [Verrucomicrobiae bacterium]HVX83917.1 hypothetical protein [Phycisphaerae bacterium]